MNCRFDNPVPEAKNRRRGAVLLEVVLALVLFAITAAVIGSALSASLDGVERQKLNTHAADLAVSVLSEIQLGLRGVDTTGPVSFDSPFDAWTWELVLAPAENELGEASDLTLVEVVIRHTDPALTYRLAQVLKLEKPKSPPAANEAAAL